MPIGRYAELKLESRYATCTHFGAVSRWEDQYPASVFLDVLLLSNLVMRCRVIYQGSHVHIWETLAVVLSRVHRTVDKKG